MKHTNFIWLILLAALVSCREAFNPPEVVAPPPTLVVEGMLVAGGAPTSIRLSRSTVLNGGNNVVPENGATVYAEGRDNTVYPLTPAGPTGFYTSANLGIQTGQEYRLVIRTTEGKEYNSEWMLTRQTPAIDSVGFRQTSEGVRFYVNSQDPTNNTRYYKWDWDETWEIRSPYYSTWIYRGGDTVSPRIFPDEDVSTCWKYGASTSLLIGTSAKLGEDRVFEAPINFIPNSNEKLSARYSMLVRQYAIDKAAYEFYELMRRNTESLGTIFDAQPTEISGNIRCISDPAELVIGYVTASTVTSRRFFVLNSELTAYRYFMGCMDFRVPNHPDSIRADFTGGANIPYVELLSELTGQIIGFMAASAECVDCRVRGGSLIKPSYW